MSHISQMRTGQKLPVNDPEQLAFAKGLLTQAATIVVGHYQPDGQPQLVEVVQLNQWRSYNQPSRGRGRGRQQQAGTGEEQQATTLTIMSGLKNYYYDWTWNEHRAELGLFVPGLPRGLGVTVSPDDGTVSFVGDTYGAGGVAAQVISQVTQVYTTLAVREALSRLGFSVTDPVEVEGGKLGITGVQYA